MSAGKLPGAFWLAEFMNPSFDQFGDVNEMVMLPRDGLPWPRQTTQIFSPVKSRKAIKDRTEIKRRRKQRQKAGRP